MVKTLLTIILIILSSVTIFAQTENSRVVKLSQLEIDNPSLTFVLSDVEEFMSNKANGFLFPVSKIVFSEFDDLLCFHIVGIDNSWTDLFKFGEMAYGYVIINNRLYVVAGEGYQGIDLNSIFHLTDQVKSFNKTPLPPSGIDRSPVWFFEFKDENAYFIGASDLDVLD